MLFISLDERSSQYSLSLSLSRSSSFRLVLGREERAVRLRAGLFNDFYVHEPRDEEERKGDETKASLEAAGANGVSRPYPGGHDNGILPRRRQDEESTRCLSAF